MTGACILYPNPMSAVSSSTTTVPKTESRLPRSRHRQAPYSAALPCDSTQMMIGSAYIATASAAPGRGARLGRLAQAHDAHAALHEALDQVVGGRVGVAAREDGPRALAALGRRGARGRQHLQQRQQRPRLARARRPLRGISASYGWFSVAACHPCINVRDLCLLHKGGGHMADRSQPPPQDYAQKKKILTPTSVP